MNPLDWIGRLWEATPNGLKRFVGWGVASGLAVAVVLAALALSIYLLGGADWVKEKFSGVAQQEDITEQTGVLKEAGENAIENVVARYDTTLKVWLRAEREQANDTILVPLLNAVLRLDKNQREMIGTMRQSNARLEQLPYAYDEKLQRLMQQQNKGDETQRLLRDIMERMNEQNEQLEEIKRQQDGRRITKKKF